MRARTIAVLGTAASLFVADAARAASGPDNRSRGTGSLVWQSREPIPGPTSDEIGGSTLQVQVGADLDPLKDPSKPLLYVNLTDVVLLEARWEDGQSIDLVLVDAPAKSGTFEVKHTLAPHMKLFIDAFGFKLTYDYDATTLLGYVPGSEWSYLGAGAVSVAPWAFDAAHLKVKAPALEDAQLFGIPLPSIAGSTPLTGTLALNATTSPTFDYVTTEVLLEGGAITTKGGSLRVPATDADYLDVPAHVEGAITYSGTLVVRPSVTITKIGNVTLPFALTLDVPQAGVDLPYANTARDAIPVVFPPTTFHVPLPNLKAAPKLDLGSADVGASASGSAKLTNTGEMAATFTATSSDPQFVVAAAAQTAKSKSDGALEVTFRPTKPGRSTATITIASNDPNEPVQEIEVSGTGVAAAAPAPAAEPDDATIDEPPADTGCGCRTAPAPRMHGAIGLGLAGLALAAWLRRRRAAS